MDQNTFNFWYTQYVKSTGYYPASPDHINQFINMYYKYYFPQPPSFIPISQNNVIPVAPEMCQMQVSDFQNPEPMESQTQVSDLQNSDPVICQSQTNENEKPNYVKLNKKYGFKNKEDCRLGMSCKNVYCTYFHHPCADPEIFLKFKK